MKNIIVYCKIGVFTLLVLFASFSPQAWGATPLGTTFTYQGRLAEGGTLANGNYDLTFTLFDVAAGGNPLGTAVVTNGAPVSNGLFTVALDFGSVFDGNGRWLEIGVKSNGAASFVALVPRQALTPSAQALYAAQAGGVSSGQVVSSLNGLRDQVMLGAGSNIVMEAVGNELRVAATVTQGPQGPTGVTGPQGSQGPVGPQGVRGLT